MLRDQPQGLFHEIFLFVIEGRESSIVLMCLANGTKLGGIVSTDKDGEIIQDKLDDLISWSDRNGMQFIKCKDGGIHKREPS